MSPVDDGSDKKFKAMQQVMIVDIVINGYRRDSSGRVIQYMTRGIHKGKIEVEINTVRLYYDESKLIDANEYWDKKNKEGK